MINFLDEVRKKINDNLNPEKLELIDNSALHVKHKSFDKNKFHIKLKISSEKLKKLGKIEAHKVIFSTLKDEMVKIHALEIEIN
tara:strand:+ start:1125 stop:1376 length:252 start_codon:yes stop_codon:yes gene_type:complete